MLDGIWMQYCVCQRTDIG